MKDRRKRVFLMSVLAFLVTASTVYIFLILSAVSDLKSKPYLISQYSGSKRAVLPILKYLGAIDSDVVSKPKQMSDEDIKNATMAMSSNMKSLTNSSDEQGMGNENSSNNYYGSKYSSVNRNSYKPSSKLSSQLSGASLSSGGQSNTSSAISGGFTSRTGSSNVSISQASAKNDSSTNSSNLMTRLNATKNLMTNALNAKSADAGRLNMEKAFSGSVKSDNNMMYKNNALELDKMKAGVMDLKLADNKGLKAPDVGAPEMDRNTVGGDKTKELLDSLKKDMAQSVINAIGNGLNQGMGGAMGGGGDAGSEPETRSGIDNETIQKEVDKWKFTPDEKVQTTFFPCGMVNCSEMGVSGGIYKAYFPDGFVLSLNSSGKPLDYYYCVSPVNEAQFIQNYNTYIGN